MTSLRSTPRLCLLPLCAWILAGCTPDTPGPDPETHRKEIQTWQAQRVKRLQAEDGWLTLIGLFWLSPGENRCGSDTACEILLPAERAPAHLGSFILRGETVLFTVAKGARVTCDSIGVSVLELRNDNDEEGPTILHHGSLMLYVIRRGDQLGVRVKDSESQTRRNFKGLEYFPISLEWRVEAEYRPYETPKVLSVPAMSGPPQEFTFPGRLLFMLGGKECSLDAAMEEGVEEDLFLMFGDETNGRETYGAGRQLYTDLPDSLNRVTIDFNRAYNWPCVFTEFATCPLPPPENQLKIRVEAGEKMPAGHSENQ